MISSYHVYQILYVANHMSHILAGRSWLVLRVWCDYNLLLFLSSFFVQMPEASMQSSQRSGGSKAVLPPHALALYQQQITMAHGESSQEVKQQQQQLSGQPGKQQQPYNPQAERDREALRSSSPRVRPRSPSTSDKDGTHTCIMTDICCLWNYECFKSPVKSILY